VTAWFERRPGSEETLLALYDAVGAAEEADLEEQAQDEASRAEFPAADDWPPDEADERGGVGAGDEEDSDGTHVTMSQAVGLVEHLLGGRPMSDGGQSAS
jgi:hypothetical protein